MLACTNTALLGSRLLYRVTLGDRSDVEEGERLLRLKELEGGDLS